jgi:hypothetical protein
MSEPTDEEIRLLSEKEVLQEGVKRIVVSRERTPRSPGWQRAWWRVLQRYHARLARLRGDNNQ